MARRHCSSYIYALWWFPITTSQFAALRIMWLSKCSAIWGWGVPVFAWISNITSSLAAMVREECVGAEFDSSLKRCRLRTGLVGSLHSQSNKLQFRKTECG